ncbi:ABC transporter permease [Miltoncostaea marina]|uniref:ABC transporter permease n=1 Tax=Miltoncostaea marina TaxID=2843215 RepID=UPI001C3DB0EA|nr:ABC transporter permease [Miltoncostaea marina]
MTGPPGVSWPVYRLTLRSLVAGRRLVALSVLVLVPVVAAIVFASAGEIDPRIFWARLLQRLVIPTVTAFVAVVIGASAIGEEREDGTILYLAATPLSRTTLVLTKVLAAWTLALALLVPSIVAAAAISLGDRFTAGQLAWPLAGVALSSLCYCAVSAWLSMTTRRPVVIGVLYILLWEGSIATFAASADRLSIAAYGRAIAVEGVQRVNAPDASAGAAVAILLIIGALATWAAARRLTRTELP